MPVLAPVMRSTGSSATASGSIRRPGRPPTPVVPRGPRTGYRPGRDGDRRRDPRPRLRRSGARADRSPRSSRTSGRSSGASSRPSSPRTWTSGSATTGSPTRSSRQCAEQGYLGLTFDEEHGGEGGGPLAGAVFVEEIQRCGSGGLAAGLWAHAGIALAAARQVRRPRTRSAATSSPASGARRSPRSGSPSPAAAPTWRAVRTTRQAGRRRLRGQRREDLHHQRRALRLHRHRRHAPPTTGATAACRCSWSTSGEGVEASALEKMGWHASDTADDRLRRRLRARGEPARRGEPRLLP